MKSVINQYKNLGIDVTMTAVIEPHNNTGGIYISNFIAAMSLTLVQQNKIGAIVSLGKKTSLPYTKEQIPNYLYIPIDDKPSQNISRYFEKSIRFIEKSRKKTNVLIHCRAGVSRSSTIVLAYLIKKYNYSLKQAFLLLKRTHKRAKPNKGFTEQLEIFAKEITGTQTTIQIGAYSRRQSPAKWQEESGVQRKQSLKKMAVQLKGSSEKIGQRFEKINDLLESNLKRSGTKSNYLKSKIEEKKRSLSGCSIINKTSQQLFDCNFKQKMSLVLNSKLAH